MEFLTDKKGRYKRSVVTGQVVLGEFYCM